jgi:hypothetical protein
MWRRPQNPQSGRTSFLWSARCALWTTSSIAEGVFEYENEAIAVELKTVRRKAKKFRKRANSLATFWDCTFESNR